MSSVTIQPDGKLYYFGRKSAIKQLKRSAVKVAVPQNVSFIIITNAPGMFLTHGPVGGSKVPYQLIEWAARNEPAFGLSIEFIGGMNMPVLWFRDTVAAKRAVAALNGPKLLEKEVGQ